MLLVPLRLKHSILHKMSTFLCLLFEHIKDWTQMAGLQKQHLAEEKLRYLPELCFGTKNRKTVANSHRSHNAPSSSYYLKHFYFYINSFFPEWFICKENLASFLSLKMDGWYPSCYSFCLDCHSNDPCTHQSQNSLYNHRAPVGFLFITTVLYAVGEIRYLAPLLLIPNHKLQ